MVPSQRTLDQSVPQDSRESCTQPRLATYLRRLQLASCAAFFGAIFVLGSSGCGGGSSAPPSPPSPPSPTITSVAVSCSPSTIQTNQTSKCSATVTGSGSFDPSVSWSVDNGTIDANGNYTPSSSPTTATVKATSKQDSTKNGTAAITVQAAPTITSVSVSCNPTTVSEGQTSQCSASVQGTGNFDSSVTWSVDIGTISSSGVFTAPNASGTATIKATSAVDATKAGTATVTVTVPPVTLETSSTGPDGLATFADANLAIRVIDLAFQQPLQGMNVTLLEQGSDQGIVVLDPTNEYASSIFMVGSSLSPLFLRGPKLLAAAAAPVSIDVNLVSQQFLTNAKSTVPVSLTGSMWSTLTNLFWNCEKGVPLSTTNQILAKQAMDLIPKIDPSIRAVEVAFVLAAPEALPAVPVIEYVTTLTSLSAITSSDARLAVYTDLGYKLTDLFDVCTVNDQNPLAVTVLDHYFELQPEGSPSGTPLDTASIAGTVTDAATGQLIPGASVQLAGPTPSGLSSSDGHFEFANITATSASQYALSAYKPGYVPGGKIVTLASGTTLSVNIRLAKPGPKSCAPAGSLSVLVQDPNVSSYVPNGSFTESTTGVQLVPIEGTGVVRATIPTPQAVNSCSSNSATGETVCTANGTDVYVIQGSTLTNLLPSGGTGTVTFSGGQCTTCGVVVDPVTNMAILSISQAGSPGAYRMIDLSSYDLSPAIPAQGETISESFALSSFLGPFILSPTEADSGVSANYQLFDVSLPASPRVFDFAGAGSIFPLSANLDSAAADCTTGIAVATNEGPGTPNLFLADLSQATFTPGTTSAPGTWQAPSQLQNLPDFGTFVNGPGTTAITVAPDKHLGLLLDEFGFGAFGAIQLPSTSGSGIPAVSDWVVAYMPNDPSGAAWQMPLDPHGLTSYISPNTGKAMGLMMNRQRTFIAVIDLEAFLGAQRSSGTHAVAPGVDLVGTGIVRFISIQ